MKNKNLGFYVDNLISLALREDAGRNDLTTNALIPRNQVSKAYIVVKEKSIIFGLNIAKKIFRKLDPHMQIHVPHKDGTLVSPGKRILFLKGRTRAILTGERAALNFLAHLSAIATKTHSFVVKVRPFKVQIMDTRKTTPGLRTLEKEAVRCGGGINHRIGLSDLILIKDNHIAACHRQRKSIQEIMRQIKAKTRKPIEIEVQNLSQFNEALKAKPDIILLDNMSLRAMKQAIASIKKLPKKNRPQVEASGNIDLDNVRSVAKIGVERISIGALTHTKKSIDMSLELI
ncbi:MAG: carboxylating nicotinate-nucleotide diphosphorylase [Candidatus Omnitrophota bacterium]